MFQSILLDSTSGTLKEWFQNLWNDTGFVVDYSRFEGYSLGMLSARFLSISLARTTL